MTEQQNLSIARNIKIAFFHLGSGMADVLVTGLWNRIMISDLGFAATPVSLLASLRYFLAPLGVWSGRMSDQRAVGGYRRLFWIWLGRLMMVASTFMLGGATASVANGAEVNTLTWIIFAAALFLFSLGSALSGSTFLALVYDRAPEHQRGRAVGIVWTFLLIGFTVGGILFAILLPSHEDSRLLNYGGGAMTALQPYAGTLVVDDPNAIFNVFVVAGVVMGVVWFLSLLGEEKRSSGAVAGSEGSEHSTSIRGDLKLVWDTRPMRFFAAYLSLSMLFAFSQDLILEPFGGDVFNMSAHVTTRFTAYWGSMSILGTLAFLALSRRFKWLTNANMSYLGVWLLVGTFAMFALSSFAGIRGLVTPGLILLGLGLGIWNVGTLGLMMDMSPVQRAGTFLGFWTLLVTMSRGVGVSSGGIVRDVALGMSGDLRVAYGVVFAIGTLGLLLSLWMLYQANIKAFKASRLEQLDTAAVLAGAMD